MGRGANPAKPGADATLPRARKSAKESSASGDDAGTRLAAALEQQVATSEILRIISRSRSDAQPVFDTIAANALRLCDARFSGVFSFDGTLIHVAAFHGLNAEGVAPFHDAYPCPPHRGGITQRAILTRSVVHAPDVFEDPEYVYHEAAQRADYRSTLSVPMLRDGQTIGAITVFRAAAKPFPDSQVELLKTFADQAVIAIENVRLFREVEERNRDLTDALEQQTATSDILRVISQSHTDAQPVFDTIVENVVRLCGADHSYVARFDGELLHPLAFHGFSPEALEVVSRRFPMRPSRENLVGRTALKRDVVSIPDVMDDPEYAREFAVAGGWRSLLGVPMLRDGALIGVVGVGRRAPGAFTEQHVELLKIFAAQAVIAIENVRLFTELEARNLDLTEALEQQTATSDILRVISQSQTDAQPVFETIAAAALKLCRASSGNVFTFDGEMIRIAAMVNEHAKYVEEMHGFYPRPPSRDTGVARAILTCGVVQIPDVVEDREYVISAQSAVGGFRSVLAVPLLRDGAPIGGIAVGRTKPGMFPEAQIALLQTFADQAVIAIENVRLFTELGARNHDLTEALEQQTATSEILRVISQSRMDVQPVFDAIVGAAQKLCRASSANVFTFDGELVHLTACENVNADYVAALRQMFPRPPGRDTAVLRAILTRSVVVIDDVLEDPDYAIGPHSVAGGFRSVLSVPLMRDGEPIGGIAVGRPEPGPFPDELIALLRTFADQAVIAIENVRLFAELEARTTDLTKSVEELRALGEVGQAVSSTLDLEAVLRTIVARATQLTGMDSGAIYEYDEAREEFYLHTGYRLPDELVDALRATPLRKGEGALGRLAIAGEPVQVRDIADSAIYQSRVREILIRSGHRALLAVPLLREDRLLGGLVVNRKSAGEFAPQIIDLLKTFATQSALAIQNARLFREIESKSRQLEIASKHKSEFLANMSHELRTPLNAIIGFSEVLGERIFGEMNDKQAEYVNDIQESGRHLLSLINDILDLSKVEAGRMELETSQFDLPHAIGNTLVLLRERAQRRGIALGCEVDARLDAIHADERKVKQVLLNLLSNAVKFTPEGGRIDVRAGIVDGVAQIAVTDSGVGIAPDDQAAVFEEFRQVGAPSGKVEGTGLGLAISRKFVELHGGRIWVESRVGSGSTFTFTLPLTRP